MVYPAHLGVVLWGGLLMKKMVCITMAMLLVMLCLPGCEAIQQLISNNVQSTPHVEQMMGVLAENDLEAAKRLMHPSVQQDTAEHAYAQMSAFLSGRKVDTMTPTGWQMNSNVSTAGKTREENASFQVTLDDGTQIQLAVTYLENNSGAGFSAFQIILGVS